MYALVLTYGAPSKNDTVVATDNLNRYANSVLEWIAQHRDTTKPTTVVLNAGATNTLDMTEAEAFEQAFARALEAQRGVLEYGTIRVVSSPRTAMNLWDSLSLYRNFITHQSDGAPVFVMCDKNRLPRVRYVLKHAFADFSACAIPCDFDTTPRTISTMLARRIEFLSAVMMVKAPFFYACVEDRLRHRKLERLRRASC